MLGKFLANLGIKGSLKMLGRVDLALAVKQVYILECFYPDGTFKWREEIHNKVVFEGLNDILDKYYRGSAYTAAHYCFLTGASPVFADTDTMATHPGWTELTDYDEANRPVLTMGAPSGQSLDNSASKAVYTLNQNVTLGGAGVTTANNKGGATGILVGGAALDTGNRSGFIGEIFNLTVTSNLATQ